MLSFHKYRCVVHKPNPTRWECLHFHSPPRSVTEENRSFWKDDPPLGGSNCKDCFNKFANQQFYKTLQTETPPDENMV